MNFLKPRIKMDAVTLTHFMQTGFRDDCWSTQFHKAGCGTKINSGLVALSIALHNICDAMKTHVVKWISHVGLNLLDS